MHLCKGTYRDRYYPEWPDAAVGVKAKPAQQQIAALAFSYWEARGRQGGSAAEDWFRAEQELSRRADADRG